LWLLVTLLALCQRSAVSQGNSSELMGWTSGIGIGGAVASGYVCAKGDFSHPDTLEEFAQAFKERERVLGRHNIGGLRLLNSYSLWSVVKALQPPLIVEAGVHNGFTSWLLRRASDSYGGATIVRIDPMERGWSNMGHPREIDYRGKRFQDFNSIPWRQKFPPEDLSSALVFFDDHQDQVQRLQQAQAHGFRHLYFDDNYLPGTGDALSLKDACDGSPSQSSSGGRLRKAFSGQEDGIRCTNFKRACSTASDQEMAQALIAMARSVEVYWEPPPLVAPIDPYHVVLKHIDAGNYIGLHSQHWNKALPHDEMVWASYKEPMMGLEEAALRLGLAAGSLASDREYFIPNAYVRLVDQGETSSAARAGRSGAGGVHPAKAGTPYWLPRRNRRAMASGAKV